MPLTTEDEAIVADMKQRELHLKRRQRASDVIQFRLRRYQAVFVAVTALLVVIVEGAVFVAMVRTLPDRPAWWVLGIVNIVIAAILGSMVGRALIGGRWGQGLVARKEEQLQRAFSGDLHSGRRWLAFTYEDEDISAYVPQILSYLDAHRFESVREALAFARSSRREKGSLFAERALAAFQEVADQTNTLVLASVGADGEPTIQMLRFVRSDRPGVWYVTRAPEGPIVSGLDQGQVALVTLPTPSGATISSDRVIVERADVSFAEVAPLFDDQVPGFTDGLTEDAQRLELVYALALESARVDTWLEHSIVDFTVEGTV